MSAGPQKADLKERLERARQAQKKAQAHADGSEATQQPEAQAQGTQNDRSCPKDQSIADLRLDSFLENNQKLAKGKSQLPNLAVQTRIFPPTRKGRRKFYKDWKNVPVLGRQDVTIWQRFFQLNQLDLTGWIVLIKYLDPSSMISTFSQRQFLKTMRRQDSSRDYQWLRSFLDRISGTQFAIYVHHQDQSWERYTGSLAPQGLEASQGSHAVQLSKPLYAFFGFDGWSYINLDQRLALGQREWAQAFHAYLSTHQCPENGLWWRKKDLLDQWGSEYKSMRNFMDLFRRRVLKPLYDIEFIKKVEEKETAIGLWW